MYQNFFGLKVSPFRMAPDAKVLFQTALYLESIAGLIYTILCRKGLAVLSGEAGTGKTTLLARVLQTLQESHVRCSMILHPTLSVDAFLEPVLMEFGIFDVPASKAQRLVCLQQFLLAGHEHAQLSALIVDEAHNLSPELLEEIRRLGNFDDAGEKLLQILLIGQSELDDILNRSDLRQLKPRIAVGLSIAPRSSPQVQEYLRYRWVRAGGGENLPFGPHVVDEIAGITKGIPRNINALCDSALLLAFAEGTHAVAVSHLREAARDLRMLTEKPAVPMSIVPVNRAFPVDVPLSVNGAAHVPLAVAEERRNRTGADPRAGSLRAETAARSALGGLAEVRARERTPMSKILEALQRTQSSLEGVAVSDACKNTSKAHLSSVVKDEPAAGRREGSTVRVLPLRLPLSAPLFPFDENHWYAGEQYKIIRTRINQHPRRPRVITVSSAGSADGKSVTAINIAAALSLKDDTDVLLMDGDFRRSTIYKQLGLPPGPGVLDVLAGSTAVDDALIQVEQFPNLHILPAGEPRNNPTELLDSSRWTNLTATLREAYQYVIVDAPPISSVADYDLILAKADALIVVARPDHTNRQALFRALEAVDKDKFLGIVLNYVPDWFLGDSRSYYGHYEYRGQMRQS